MKNSTAELVRSFLPVRATDAHKGSFGRVLVVAGSQGMSGAGVLCAKSALKAGAGLVTLALPQSAQPIAACQLPDLITLPLPQAPADVQKTLTDFIRLNGVQLLVLGPGLGEAPWVCDFLKTCKLPAVVDADALNSLAQAEQLQQVFPRAAVTVLTPHPGEMARLLKREVGPSEEERVVAVRELATITGGVCLLKGHETLVAREQDVVKNTTGGPALAKAGAGDVLCGLIAGFWAQSGAAANWDGWTAFQAAVCGVYLHGLCGDLAARELTDYCVLSSELTNYLPAALRQTLRRD